VTVLTGEDADKFIRQVRYGRPKAAAFKMLERGKKLSAQMREQGFVKIERKREHK
jgi:hypothetical protein